MYEDKSKEELIAMVLSLRKELDELNHSRTIDIAIHNNIEYSLTERLMELNCHNRISELMHKPDMGVDQLINDSLAIIQSAYQFPDITEVSIRIQNKIFETPRFKEATLKHFRDIVIWGSDFGRIEVGYLEDDRVNKLAPFFREEENLLFTISVRLGNYIEKSENQTSTEKNEALYRSIITASPDSITITDLDGKIEFASPGTTGLFGYETSDMVVGSLLTDHLHPSSRARALEAIRQMFLGNMLGAEEYNALKSDGSVFDIEVNAEFIRDNNRNPSKIVFVTRDITARKKIENELKESNERTLSIMNSMDAFIYISDMQTHEVLFVNDYGKIAWGADIVGSNCYKSLQGLNAPCGFCTNDRLLDEAGLPAGVVTWEFQNTVNHRWYDIRDKAIPWKDGKLVRLEIATDITEKKLAELSIRKLSLAVEQSPVSIVITNLDGNIEYANPKACKTTGYTIEELVGQNPRVLKSGETDSNEYQALWDNISTGKEWRGIFHNKRKDGELYWESSTITPIQDETGKIINYLAIKEDITQRRNAETEMRKFRMISDMANYGTAIADLNGVMVYSNNEFARMHGYTVDEMIGQNLRMLHTDEQFLRVGEVIETLQQNGSFYAEEIWRVRKDGSVFPSLMNAMVLFDDKQRPEFMWATTIDITELKSTENSLRESEQRLNFAQELGEMGSWELNIVTNEVKWSKNLFRMMGMEPVDHTVSNDLFWMHVYPEDLHIVSEKMDEMMLTKQPISMEIRMMKSDGSVIWIDSNIIPEFEDGNMIGLKGATLDICRKKEYQAEIQQKTEKLTAIINAMPDLIFVIDQEGFYREYYCSNPSMLLSDKDQIIGTNLGDFFNHDMTVLHMSKIRECLEKNELISYEYTVNQTPEPTFWEARMTPMGSDRVLSFVRDITTRKNQDEEIKMMSLAVEQSPVSIVITDLNANIEYVNPAFAVSCGYDRDELTGRNTNILKSGKTERVTYTTMWDTISMGKTWQGEWINKKKNGELFWENVLITPIFDKTGNITNYLGVKQDITQRKEAENEIRDLNANLEKRISERTDQLTAMNNNLIREIEERKQIEDALMVKTQELENFFTVTLDLLCIADSSGKFIKVNKAWEHTLGYSVEELQRKSFRDFIHPDDVEASNLAIQQLSEQKPVFNFTNRYRNREGNYRFIEWRSAPFGNMIYSAARDVTEQKRAYEFELELLQLSTQLTGIGVSEIEHSINLALSKIGSFLDVDRSYIFEMDFENDTMSNTYEWCKEGISSEKENLQKIPNSQLPNWVECITRNEDILIPSVADLPPDWQNIREMLEPQGIRSLVVIPILINNKPHGFLGLDVVTESRDFKTSEINTLKIWSSMIAGLINKQRNEKLLEQTRQNYETFFNTIDDFLFVLDKKGSIIHTNSTAWNRLGFSQEELIGRHILTLRPPERQTEAKIVLKEILNGKTEQCSIPLITKTGEQIPIETRVKPGFWDGQPILFAVSKDISQIKLSEQKFSTAFQSNSAMMAISYFDEGTYVDVNNEFSEVLGYPREELIGKSNKLLGLFIDQDLHSELLDYVRNNIPVRKFEIRMRTKSGGIKTGLLSADSIFIGDKRCLLTVTMDISERKKAEEEILKARMEAEQANMAKSEFLSRMSHELRTPMNSILGFSQLLQMSDLTPGQNKGVNHIMHSGKHLLDLINEVLDISRIESGRLSLSLEPVQLAGLIGDMTGTMAPLARDYRVKIIAENSPDDALFVRADRQRLKQVLLNLITNAVKYNKQDGTVTIKTKVLEQESSGLSYHRISVADTGTGIQPEDIGKLFKPFERIGAEKTAIEGSGLGLAVVKKLMDAMGGKVGVESTRGIGTTFWIDLPTAESQFDKLDKSGILKEPLMATEKMSGKVLYIEDNLSNIELVDQILSSQRPDIRLLFDTHGNNALPLAIEHRPNLILLDLNLPDIHGNEVFAMLQENELTKDIPVVVISADAMPHQLEKLLLAGVKDYLTKPLDIKVFLKIVDEFLGSPE